MYNLNSFANMKYNTYLFYRNFKLKPLPFFDIINL